MQKASSVLLLFGSVLLCMALGIGISIFIAHFFDLTPALNQPAATSLRNADQWYIRIFIHALGHFFTFLVPAILFWYVFENKKWDEFSSSNLSEVKSAWISVAVVIFLIPVNKQIIDWNQNLQLPGIFKEVEGWMRAKEQEKMLLTKGLLQIGSMPKLLVALMVFALIGPIGEEVFFRGVLQRKLRDWGLSPVRSIWVAAIIFSLIHFQFYGFFPRLLLGALFGYLFLWSGNIWIPIAAHVVNNGIFVLTSIAHQNGLSLSIDIEAIVNNWLSVAISLILTACALFFFRRQNCNPA